MATRRKATRKGAPRKKAVQKGERTSGPAGRAASAGARPAPALKRVRALALALPEATEKEAWGAPTFRVRDKLFAHFRDNHHGDGRLALWIKAPPGDQAMLVDADPDRFFVPPYVGPSGWIGVRLEDPAWDLIEDLLRTGYRMNASKKQLAALDAS